MWNVYVLNRRSYFNRLRLATPGRPQEPRDHVLLRAKGEFPNLPPYESLVAHWKPENTVDKVGAAG